MSDAFVIRTEDLTKVYEAGENRLVAIDAVNFAMRAGAFVAVMGPSGSGKSTFLNIIGCLDRPTSGHYYFDGNDVARYGADERARLRREHIGFVFQAYNLLARTDAIENVELPMIYAGIGKAERRRRAIEALRDVRLPDQYHRHMPSELSGGQQQRIAIARALVTRPSVILADEPTGALDSKTSNELMQLFFRLNAERKLSILMVTHEPHVAQYAERLVTFLDGRIVSDQAVTARTMVTA
ncbi:MAG TPA: ABC transporter ATP-binding protein [Candidatus Aquilonibacter sp.]|nr:ABC transporter ATP-binding protein [Candidatus Aquilonibacter sp.]